MQKYFIHKIISPTNGEKKLTGPLETPGNEIRFSGHKSSSPLKINSSNEGGAQPPLNLVGFVRVASRGWLVVIDDVRDRS